MDYKTQLRNTEKRDRFVTVATVRASDLNGPLDPAGALAVSNIPKGCIIGRAYAVVTEPFAKGSTLTWGFIDTAGAVGDALLTDLDLASVSTARSQKPAGGVYTFDTLTGIVPNAAAFSSAVGEVKLVIELVDPDATSGTAT